MKTSLYLLNQHCRKYRKKRKKNNNNISAHYKNIESKIFVGKFDNQRAQ